MMYNFKKLNMELAGNSLLREVKANNLENEFMEVFKAVGNNDEAKKLIVENPNYFTMKLGIPA